MRPSLSHSAAVAAQTAPLHPVMEHGVFEVCLSMPQLASVLFALEAQWIAGSCPYSSHFVIVPCLIVVNGAAEVSTPGTQWKWISVF